MSWEQTLLPASYKGVEFEVQDIEDDLEAAVAVNDYPYRNGGNLEDMGRLPRVILVTAIFYGDDYEERLQTFLKAIDTGGAGELVHPIFGSINAMFLRSRIRHRAERPDSCSIELDFMEDSLDRPLFDRVLPARDVEVVEEAADDALDGASDQFLIDFTTLQSLPALVKDNLSDDMLNVMDNMRAYADQILAARAWVRSAVYYINNPQAFIDDLTGGLLSRLNGIFAPMDLHLKYFGNENASNDRGSIAGVWTEPLNHLRQPLITSTNSQIQPALVTHVAVQQAVAIAGAAGKVFALAQDDQVLTPSDIETIAGDVRQVVNTTLEQVRATYPDVVASQPIVEPLKDLALAVSDAAAGLIRMKPPLLSKTVDSPANLHLLAFRWYGDYDRAGELLRLNPEIINPNFIARGAVLRAYAA
ncbi:DNA circularization N-terminal domain-containing protein [uncultured Herbaspirillum sp.]|uniref:DNA circularization protein n=1 Tax=uncultured Herbaspirillum sp. TaxID=160236 RepID=UPI002637218F|nr:DNA circularization N-terminal domain-containing protein [uncultured Herbaspirillum sp.]